MTATGVPFEAERTAEPEARASSRRPSRTAPWSTSSPGRYSRGRERAGCSSFLAASLGTLAFGGTIVWLFAYGVGTWGINSSVVWGSPVANYVWWIGIGNAGTLISALLLITRQPWRASINRFAEAMTIFAVAIAGHIPDHPPRPAHVFLLAGPLPQHHDALAAMAQRAGLGLLGDPELPAVLDHVLVQRHDPGPRGAARPGAEADHAAFLRRAGARLARLGAALAGLPHVLGDDGGAGRATGLLGAFHRGPRLRCEPDARLAGADLPALFRRWRDVLGLRDGGGADGGHPLGLRPAIGRHAAPLRHHRANPRGVGAHHGAFPTPPNGSRPGMAAGSRIAA